MRSDKTIRNFLQQFLPRSLRRNLPTLFEAVGTVLHYGRLTLAGIARWMKTGATVKNNLKRVDRLLTNPTLHNALVNIAARIARILLPQQAVLLVDWTPCGPEHHALVLSLPHSGRAIPIYFQVHPERLLGNPQVEAAFLRLLKNHILPHSLTPLLVTDAGFRAPWFRQVLSHGWHFLGRSISRVSAQPCEGTSEVWWQMTALHEQATATPTEHGWWRMPKRNPMKVRLVSLKQESVRLKSQKRGRRRAPTSHAQRKARRRALQPWMLWTNLPEGVNAAKVVEVYGRRMWIEEQFRDDKTGVGLGDSGAYRSESLTGLRVVGQLVTLVSHSAGVIGEALELSRKYQVNTVTERRVLSLPYLGRQLLFHEDRRRLPLTRFNAALQTIQASPDVSWKTTTPEKALAA